MDSVLKRYLLEKYPLLCIAKTNQTPRGQAIASVLSLYGVRIKLALREKKNVTEICFIDMKTKKTFLTKKRFLIS